MGVVDLHAMTNDGDKRSLEERELWDALVRARADFKATACNYQRERLGVQHGAGEDQDSYEAARLRPGRLKRPLPCCAESVHCVLVSYVAASKSTDEIHCPLELAPARRRFCY